MVLNSSKQLFASEETLWVPSYYCWHFGNNQDLMMKTVSKLSIGNRLFCGVELT
jgi:hypothetical protein